MAVNITWSATNGGSALSEALDGGGSGVDHGIDSNGTILTARTIYIKHDGVNPITNCGFYIAEYSGVYGGAASVSADKNELIAWGDGSTEDSFGGFQINMDAVGSFPSSAWPTYTNKLPTNGSAFYTGRGDDVANKIPLVSNMGLDNPAAIQVGTSPNVRFQCRIAIPQDEDTTGVRQFDHKLRFTFTS